MIRCLVICFICMFSTASLAETIVAARIIPANTVITIDDLRIAGGSGQPVTAKDVSGIVGMEARKALFAGRPISVADVSIPAVVERNQTIQLIYQTGGLLIKTEGRALDRGSPGDAVRVMNLASRSIVSAILDEVGVGYVSQ